MRPGRMIDHRHRHQLRARRVQIEVIRRIVKCSNFFLHFYNCLLSQRSFTLRFVSEKVTKLSQGLSQGLAQVCHKNGKNPQFSSNRRTLFIIISENSIEFECKNLLKNLTRIKKEKKYDKKTVPGTTRPEEAKNTHRIAKLSNNKS